MKLNIRKMEYKRKFLKLSDSRKIELTNQIIDLLKGGKSNKVVKTKIASGLKGKISENMINSLIKEAGLIIQNEYLKDAKSITAIHEQRYDRIISENLKIEELDQKDIVSHDGELIVDGEGNISEKQGITFAQWQASRNRKTKAYDDVLDTLQQKENLLQLVNLNLEIDINEEIDINLHDKKSMYDTSKLTFEEQVELLQLMKKARKGNKEIQSITEIESEVHITEDVIAEVLPANIEQIKQVPAPVEIQDNSAPFDPTRKLRENLAKLAARKLKEAGGNLDSDEKKLLD